MHRCFIFSESLARMCERAAARTSCSFGACVRTSVLYLLAKLFRKPICHWIVGDPVALLQTGLRKGPVADRFALLYALQDRVLTRLGRWLADGVLLCNGRDLARVYASPRTIEIVSSTVGESEFFSRASTRARARCAPPLCRIYSSGEGN